MWTSSSLVPPVLSMAPPTVRLFPKSNRTYVRSLPMRPRNWPAVKLTTLTQLRETATGRKAICDWGPPQPGDSPGTWADISKASHLLGYRPATSLEEGLASCVNWYRDVAPVWAPTAHTAVD